MSSITKINSIDVGTLSFEVPNLAWKIGELEGCARANGFLASPVGPKVDNNQIDLENFKTKSDFLKSLRGEVDAIYRQFHKLSSECVLIPNPEIRNIFENQIKTLHEKRAVLDASLREFEYLLVSHSNLKKVSDDLEHLEKDVTDYEGDNLSFDCAPKIRDHLEQLSSSLTFIDRWKLNSSQLHSKQKQDILWKIQFLKLKLNTKEIKRREEILNRVKDVLKEIKLLEASNQMPDSILRQKMLSILKSLEIFPMEMKQEIYTQAKDIRPPIAVEIKSSRINLWKNLLIAKTALVNSSVRYLNLCSIPSDSDQEESQTPQTVASETRCSLIKAPELLNSQSRADSTQKNNRRDVGVTTNNSPVSVPDLINAFEGKCPTKPTINIIPVTKDLAGVNQKIQDAVQSPVKSNESLIKPNPSLQPKENLEQIRQEILSLPIKTLEDLKQRVLRVEALDNPDREKFLQTLLDSAEKNGLALDGPKGVYYCIWFIAHQLDQNAGGDNFGKVQAPKDLKRLCKAIEMAIEKSSLSQLSLAEALQTIPKLPLKSLDDLKKYLLMIQKAGTHNPLEKEQITQALLAAAEINGIHFDQADGVYFWVWSIAHAKDNSAGGDNFGKVQAPKDLERLIEAIDKVNSAT